MPAPREMLGDNVSLALEDITFGNFDLNNTLLGLQWDAAAMGLNLPGTTFDWVIPSDD